MKNHSNIINTKRSFTILLFIIAISSLFVDSCKKKEEENAPVVNSYTVKYKVKCIGGPTSFPFTINYYQDGTTHTSFVMIPGSALVQNWEVDLSAKTGDYLNLKCEIPHPPAGYQTLCVVSIEATPSDTPIYLEETSVYPDITEISDTLP